MKDWKEELYHDCLERNISPSIVHDHEQFPDCIQEYLLPFLEPYGYSISQIKHAKDDNDIFLHIYLTSEITKCFISIIKMLDPKNVYVGAIIFNKNKENIAFDTYLKSKGVSVNNFQLSSYEGDYKQKVHQFCEWLIMRIKTTKLLDVISGKIWFDDFYVEHY